jgi:hypothetical protein
MLRDMPTQQACMWLATAKIVVLVGNSAHRLEDADEWLRLHDTTGRRLRMISSLDRSPGQLGVFTAAWYDHERCRAGRGKWCHTLAVIRSHFKLGTEPC